MKKFVYLYDDQKFIDAVKDKAGELIEKNPTKLTIIFAALSMVFHMNMLVKENYYYTGDRIGWVRFKKIDWFEKFPLMRKNPSRDDVRS